ncbi:MAG TPA: lantibiotic dehydratase [Polyangiaceae bacterium]|nr:lantibiotic dehydratase [Polyangiaceae bacterium]
MLRTPLLPFEALFAPEFEAPRALAEGGDLEAALAADRRSFWARTLPLLDEPEVREAIELASPSFAEALAAWRANPSAPRGASAEATLVRYLQRMAGRATPFGLFAGQTPGAIADRTELRLAPRASYRRRTRLRRDALLALAASAPPATKLRANPTIYRASAEAHELRYLAASGRDGEAGQAASVEASGELERVLAYAAEARERADLVAFTVREGATPAEAEEFVSALVAGELLVSEGEPPLTGDDPFRALLSDLGEREDAGTLAAQAAALIEALDAANARAELAWGPDLREPVVAALGARPGTDASPARALSVTLHKPAEAATLSEASVARLDAAARALAAMGFVRGGDPLRAFKKAYRARFEDEELPLLAALDLEVGVGAALAGAAGPVAAPAPPARLVSLLTEALARGARSIDLGDDDIAALRSPRARPLPAAYAAVAQIAYGDEAGEHALYLQGAQGPSGARLLGRFAHDAPMRALVAEHLRAEEALDPDAVFAEIVHAPGGGAADGLVRPALRAYEIACLSRSSAPAERRLELADLRVAVREGRVVLRSKRLGRRVVPRGTHAHHFAGSPVLAYRFLGLLQEQGVAADVAWGWGALDAAPFLPRVSVGGVVVSLARWRLSGDERRALATSSGAALVRAASAIRAARGLPRYVALPDGDRVALVDFDSVVSLEAAAPLFARESECVLQELFVPPGRSCVRGEGGAFAHELIVPLVARESPEPAPGGPSPAPRASSARAFPPGSEWLYVRLEAAGSLHDRLLAEVVAPVVKGARASGAIDAWFFVRFADPAPHLRVRFHGDPGRLRSGVLGALEQACGPHLRERRLARVALDTYVREVERYGGDLGVALAERFFHLDSEATLELVEGGSLDDSAGRWRAALVGVDRLFGDLGLDVGARLRLVTRLSDACRGELGLTEAAARRLDARFRAERPGLGALYAGEGGALHAAFTERSRRSVGLMRGLEKASREGALHVSLEAFAATLAHLHVGRLVSGALRPVELIVYDFLRRLYRSQIARRGGG